MDFYIWNEAVRVLSSFCSTLHSCPSVVFFCHGFCACHCETVAGPAKYQNKASMMQSSNQQGFNLY